MSARRWMVGCVVAAGLLAGCQQPERATVAVRFTTTTFPQQLAADAPAPEQQLAGDAGSEGFSFEPGTSPPQPAPFQVTLWGGGFAGQDVTYTNAGLRPGAYTFASWEPDQTPIQGWIEVHPKGGHLIDMFRDWQQQLIEQKEMLAYDYELHGGVQKNDTATFRSFQKQLYMLERMLRRIQAAISREVALEQSRATRQGSFLKDTAVLLFPRGEQSLTPTTAPAFTPEELDKVRGGEVMTKLVLVADYQDVQWKLQRVERLRNHWLRAKASCLDMLERLERRKRMLRITDHLHRNDRTFVANELRMQQIRSQIDRLDDRIGGLRERRLALAFASELVAPDGAFHPLDREQRDLADERAVLEDQRRGLDARMQELADDNTERVALERRRLWFTRAIDDIDGQLQVLSEARVALGSLKEGSQIIHRQGDFRLLATSFVGDQVSFPVRNAIESQALMTIRLQASEHPFAPRARLASFGE